MFDDLHPDRSPFDGRWWMPSEPTHLVGGRLYLVDGTWTLTLFGWLGAWDFEEEAEPVFPEVIHGFIDTSPITLFGLAARSWPCELGAAPHKTNFAVNSIVAGAHVAAATRYRTAGVQLLNLNEWVNRQPWRLTSGAIDTQRQRTATFLHPVPLTASVPGASVRLARDLFVHSGSLSNVKMTSDEWVYFDFEEPLALEAILREFHRPLSNLLELASGDRCPTLGLTVVPEDADDRNRPLSVMSAMARGSVPEPRPAPHFLFTLKDIGFDTVIERWWQLEQELGIVPDLLAALSGTGFVGAKFLTAASAVEGYHRHRHPWKQSAAHRARVKRLINVAPEEDRSWLTEQLAFSGRPTFAERLSEVVTYAGKTFTGTIGNVEAWATWVKKGRDSVAHRDPKMPSVDREWLLTARVTATIRWLMTIVLLRDLGLADQAIAAGLQRDRGFIGAIENLREVKPGWFEEPTVPSGLRLNQN